MKNKQECLFITTLLVSAQCYCVIKIDRKVLNTSQRGPRSWQLTCRRGKDNKDKSVPWGRHETWNVTQDSISHGSDVC